METPMPDMQMPPQFKQAYQRVLLAGMKVLFSKQANQQLLPSGDPQELAKAIINVVTTLFNQSKGKMPPEVIIPAAVSLLMEAHKMLEKSGEAKPETLGEAMEMMIPTMLKNFGMPVEQIQELFDKAEGGETEEETTPMKPGKPMQKGLLGGAMMEGA